GSAAVVDPGQRAACSDVARALPSRASARLAAGGVHDAELRRAQSRRFAVALRVARDARSGAIVSASLMRRVIEAAVVLVLARVTLAIGGFPRVRRMLTREHSIASRDDDAARAREIARAMLRASRR